MVSWKELELGCTIVEPGSSSKLKTGDWRSQRPVTDYEKCVKCGMCYIFCPDMVYKPNKMGFFQADYYYCKGCGICARECPAEAITMVEEKV
ncbi:MAG: 4Fe-4S binding protein [Deltaproteobacteria bacterium]|nr:4Fe-4S binding protein [Deltaproteobacteria bacterium]MBW2070433.1 4Fe-4S binding protein [Deltaproteobacteria bacterium]